jgi:deoxycytidylate deaminase
LGNTAKKLPVTPNKSTNTSSTSSQDRHNTLDTRESKELVIALCGPIGSGAVQVRKQLQSILKEQNYDVVHVRISTLIEDHLAATNQPLVYLKSDKYERYDALMNAGDRLRKQKGHTFTADLAIAHIAFTRERKAQNSEPSKDDTEPAKNEAFKKRRAYIVDQLKHPDEYKALQRVYGGIFYFIGVLCEESRRVASLMDDGIGQNNARHLVERDKEENEKHGQKLEKTLYHADFFINNSNPNTSEIKFQLNRFFKLTHGKRGVTPTKDESGMYAAYAASLESACLSRQVGAVIMDPDGLIIAKGHNDVPKFGGGLYTEEDNIAPNTQDHRCLHRDNRCHNDLHKRKLRNKLHTITTQKLENYELSSGQSTANTPNLSSSTQPSAIPVSQKLSPQDKEQLINSIVDALYSESPIKSLIEYSRAIHAEMDAIVSVARRNSNIPINSTLYGTTFPCHNCARHIVAAGITRVVYIEPYEKSLAFQLHSDSMSSSRTGSKAVIEPFQGVAPARYNIFFSKTKPDKDDRGYVISDGGDDNPHVDTVPVDSYIDREASIAAPIIMTQYPATEGTK